MQGQLLWVIVVSLLVLDQVHSMFGHSKRKARRIQSQNKYYDAPMKPWYSRFYTKMKQTMLCADQFPNEFTEGPNQFRPNIDQMSQYMQRLDDTHESFIRSEMRKINKLLIIAPTTASDQYRTITLSQDSTLNPELYNGQRYSIAFQIGDLYPPEYPYLSVYLTVCRRPHKSAKTSDMIHLKTMFVDYATGAVLEHPPGIDTSHWHPATSSASDVFTTLDQTHIFEWTVPDGQDLFPHETYCLYFDMTSFNPAESFIYKSKYQDYDTKLKQGHMNLKYIKPSYHMLSAIAMSNLHQHQLSALFPITQPPSPFTERWFVNQFGGVDLERLVGGSLVSFKQFEKVFNLGHDPGWPADLVKEMTVRKAETLAEWYWNAMMQNTANWRETCGGQMRPAYMNTGYGLMEDRRRAQQIASGLLFHPHGRKVLSKIGDIFLQVAAEYEEDISSYSGPNNMWRQVSQRFVRLWTTKLGGFKMARSRLVSNTLLMKKMSNIMPSDEWLQHFRDDWIRNQKGGLREPITGKWLKHPAVVERNIIVAVRDMMMYEISLTILAMGRVLLERKGRMQNFLDAIFHLGDYEGAKFAAVATTMKLYGSKFKSMSKSYSKYPLPSNSVFNGQSNYQLWADDSIIWPKDSDPLERPHSILSQEDRQMLDQISKTQIIKEAEVDLPSFE
ncbi:hypothetical protein MIR68_009431 [Amoeboaphelidium protococcarum]|nr:hypothetical protein MIR68_009431 [Amoeboaphelidium protococcarum]